MTFGRSNIKIISTLVIAIAFVLSNCKNSNDKIVDEGIIEFDVTAVDPNHPWAGMIPSVATLKFIILKF